MKGVTPVISLIMMMLVTVGTVGVSYAWLSGIATVNTEKIITIPPGGAQCYNNKISVVARNSGTASNITDDDIIIADIDGVNVKNSLFFGNFDRSGLAGYWRFENNAKDYSNYGHDGTAYGNAHVVSNGMFGSAMDFDGSGDYLSVGSLGIPANGPATIEGWFYFRDRAMDRGSDMQLYGDFVYQHSVNNYEYVYATNDYLPWIPSKNVWYHVAITYSGDTSTAKAYVNGVRYNWNQQTGPHTIPAFPGRISNGANALNGIVDEVRVWNRVLSFEEILQLNKTGSGNFTTGPNKGVQLINNYPVFSGGKHTIRVGTKNSVMEATVDCL